MIVTERRKRLSASKRVKDIQAGDFVRRVGHRGVGVIESVQDDHAWVAWKNDRKDFLPLVTLRLVRAIGGEFDRRTDEL